MKMEDLFELYVFESDLRQSMNNESIDEMSDIKGALITIDNKVNISIIFKKR